MSGYPTGLRSPWWASLACLRDPREASAPSPHRGATGLPTPRACWLCDGGRSLPVSGPLPPADMERRDRGEAPAGAERECVPTGLPSILTATAYRRMPSWGSGHSRIQAALGGQAWPLGLCLLSRCSVNSLPPPTLSASLLFTSPEPGGQRDLGGAAGLSGSLTNDLLPQPPACLSQAKSRRPPHPNIPGDATSAEK